MTSIPASQLVSAQGGVLGAGGNRLSLNAIFLTEDTSVPVNEVWAFSTLEDVQAWFGASSVEALLAAVYFSGFENATVAPTTLFFAQYNQAAAAGWLRGGTLAGMTLSQLQALSGTLALTIDGVSETTGAINLSSATSFSNAAGLIQTALAAQAAGTTCVYDSQRRAFKITSPTTGADSAVSFAAVGALATGLRLTDAAGAVESVGAVAAVPADFMANVRNQTQNWASFMTVFEPDLAVKLAFADWVTTSDNRYVYVAWDTDEDALAQNATGTFGVLTATHNGVCPVWGTADKAAFICGTTASINFEETNGRITFAYKGQAGLSADVTNATAANNLIANGYNFYGAYATASENFTFLQPGQVSGAWQWLDEYVNQIKLNSDLQVAQMQLMASAKSIPYNQTGYSMIRATALDPITSAKTFGTIRAGVTLSNSQAAQVNTQAGVKISDILQNEGWYLLVRDASPSVRAQRGSPPITLWYTSGQSVHKINMSSIDIL